MGPGQGILAHSLSFPVEAAQRIRRLLVHTRLGSTEALSFACLFLATLCRVTHPHTGEQRLVLVIVELRRIHNL
jgi:hypothetical protein